MKKIIALLLLLLTLLGCAAAHAEVERSPLLDAAFTMLEKDNIFQRRYNEITGANVESYFETGLPYFFGGKEGEKVLSKLPYFSQRKCWETTKFYRKNSWYLQGFDCSGYTRWIYKQVGLPEHDDLDNMILHWRYQDEGYHLYNHRPGYEMPPYDQLKDHLVVGDLLVSKVSARHIMMYIGTLRDYGFTAEEVPELADYLDYPLAIHCGPHPKYGERIQNYLDANRDRYKNTKTTNGGVAVSIIGVPLEAATHHEFVQVSDFYYFMLDNDTTAMTIWDLPSATSFCWFRMK
ncbi:MAG: C40 family peptidase [Clostridia bacterium]|nr:C40 family peptidase [Clostridia bacterium]